MLTPDEALAAVPLRSRWYFSGHHCTVVEVGLTRDGEPAVRLRRDGDTKPLPHRTFVSALVRRGIDHGEETTRPRAARKEQKMPKATTIGPKEAEARAQREAKATKDSAAKKPNGNGKAEKPVPPVEDVTGKEPKPDLVEALAAQLKPVGVKRVKAKSYERYEVKGRTVAAVDVTKKGVVTVEVPEPGARRHPATAFMPESEDDLAAIVEAVKVKADEVKAAA